VIRGNHFLSEIARILILLVSLYIEINYVMSPKWLIEIRIKCAVR